MNTHHDDPSLDSLLLASASMDVVKIKGHEDPMIATNMLDHNGTVTTLYFLPPHAVTLWRYIKSIVDKGRWKPLQTGLEDINHPTTIFVTRKRTLKRDGKGPSPSNMAQNIMVLDVQKGITITVTFVDQAAVCVAMLDAVTDLFFQVLNQVCAYAGIDPETDPALPYIDLQ